ncbi:hypothetical protein K5I29_11645 [Flavobacterium agricola]|uniref:Membrane protein YfhO n=1 Tax=Flavobacterium agricola TaxID=2870839 RepID=A0ABY6LYP3_9FLAO|nr:hypothetical protein [Flavobacterium agricola]UYW01112.1 hypothetical protein K5I29_11645 [Flavobacterium agricola]
MHKIKSYLPYLYVILGFVLISLLYFSPVLQGKQIQQSDITQYIGMAKEQNDFRAAHGEEPYWTNGAFGGMPTYQLGAKYPNNYIKVLDETLRFLPRPADYLFLYFVGFFILLRVLKVDFLKAFIGALAFGFSTYLIIILGVGHNAKAHAIAYMPVVIAGVLLVFRKKYIAGGLLTTVAAALEINANHFQMTYYLLIFLLVMGIFYLVSFIKAKDYKAIYTSVLVFFVAGLLALGSNASNLLATSEYAKVSTRSTSNLSFEPDGSPKVSSNGMSYEYITEYSYGIPESLNLLAPRLFGGSNNEDVGTSSSLFNFLTSIGANSYQAQEITAHAPTYWGDQPIVAAPAYVGAAVFCLAILCMFIEKRRIKYVFATGALVSLLLSWGKNFDFLTSFFIDYVPMYDKFRAVSSIQVILELCFPVLAILGLQAFYKTTDKKVRIDALKNTVFVSGVILAVILLGYVIFDFNGLSDGYFIQAYGEYGPHFVEALIEDRKSFYLADTVRSFAIIAIVLAVLFAFSKQMLNSTVSVLLIGFVMVFDLVLVDRNYVNNNAFVSARQVNEPFAPTEADLFILKDTTQFRVYDLQGGLNSARTSYFHHSLGGYHAAKPLKLQQLFDYQISKQNFEVLNMLNVKYILQPSEEGVVPLLNENANGNAWFVKAVQKVNSADAEMKALDKTDTKSVAIVNEAKFPEITKKLANLYTVDADSYINLVSYQPNELVYHSYNSKPTVAVFSEIYYPNGWNAYIDGNLAEHFEADYTLRALQVPEGKHTIIFKFEPKVVQVGGAIALIANLLILLCLVGGIYVGYKKCAKKQPKTAA